MACCLLRQSSGVHRWLLPPPLSSCRLRQYRLHCLHGQLSPLAWSPTLTGLWWLSHQCTLWGLAVCCFLKWEAWSLTLFRLLAILNTAFPCFLAGVSYRDAGSGLGPFPDLWFAWALSAGILAVLSPLLDPTKTCPVPVCILLCHSWLPGVGCENFRQHWSMLWPAPLSVCTDTIRLCSQMLNNTLEKNRQVKQGDHQRDETMFIIGNCMYEHFLEWLIKSKKTDQLETEMFQGVHKQMCQTFKDNDSNR